MQLLERLCYRSVFITFLLFSPVFWPGIADATPEEHLYFITGTDPTIYRVSIADGSPQGVSTYINGNNYSLERFLTEVFYDEVNRRLYFIWSQGGVAAGISHVQVDREDVFSDPDSATVDVVNTFAISSDLPISLAVDGTTDKIYWVQGNSNNYAIYSVEPEAPSPLLIVDRDHPDFNGSPEFNNIRWVINGRPGEDEIIFATDQSGGLGGNIYSYNPAENPSIKLIAAVEFDINEIEYDFKNNLIFAVSRGGVAAARITVDENLQLVASDAITYQWDSVEISSYEMLYREGSTGLLLGGSAASSNHLFLDSLDAGDKFTEPPSFPTNLRTIEVLAAQGECIKGVSKDSDGDLEPDCSDYCPDDAFDYCNQAVFFKQNSFFFEKQKFGTAEAKFLAGYHDEIAHFAFDQQRKLIVYTSSNDPSVIQILSLSDNEVKALGIMEFSGLPVLAITIDAFRGIGYVVVEDILNLEYQFFSFDYTVDEPTASLLFAESHGAGIGDIVIDPRESGTTFGRTLYYSFGTKIFARKLSDILTPITIGDNGAVDYGALTIDYNKNHLYAYSQPAPGRIERFNLIGGQPELISASSTLTGAINQVDLYFHPHASDENGRIYISQSSESAESIIYFNVNDSPSYTLYPADFEGENVAGMAFIESCIDTLSLDSDSDGESDCVAEGTGGGGGGGDNCPEDPNKTEPGVCGCGTPDTDSDMDGTPDCTDSCISDPLKTEPGTCGCGTPDTDSDKDGTLDCQDGCASDPAKVAPGTCGCGVSDIDSDLDGTPDCRDSCATDAAKTEPGTCGCGVSDSFLDRSGNISCELSCQTDSDSDTLYDCLDDCPLNPDLTDSDGDGVADCKDQCPLDNSRKVEGVCGCNEGSDDTDDIDDDSFPDCVDICPDDANFTDTEPVCGCEVPEDLGDDDGDGTPNCLEFCEGGIPENCGCGIVDCTGIDGPFLTPITRIANPPSVAPEGKKAVKVFLKVFTGAKELTSSLNFETLRKKRKNKRKKRRKGNAELSVAYEVVLKKIKGRKRFIQKKITKNNVVRLTRLKKGKYLVKYRAMIKSKKRTVSKTNYSPAASFRVPLQ